MTYYLRLASKLRHGPLSHQGLEQPNVGLRGRPIGWDMGAYQVAFHRQRAHGRSKLSRWSIRSL